MANSQLIRQAKAHFKGIFRSFRENTKSKHRHSKDPDHTLHLIPKETGIKPLKYSKEEYLTEEQKEIPANCLCENAVDFILEELDRRQPNTLNIVTSQDSVREHFHLESCLEDKPRHLNNSESLEQWLRDENNTVGKLITILKKLGRSDIVFDRELNRWLGKRPFYFGEGADK